MKNIVIVGAGGFGREVYQYTLDIFGTKDNKLIKGFIDSDPNALVNTNLDNSLLLGSVEEYNCKEEDIFIAAIGNPDDRKKVVTILRSKSALFLKLIHPTAYVAPNAKIEDGCIICPFAFIAVNAIIDSFSILNTYASCGHDSYVGQFCTLSPYAVVNGFAKLDSTVFMGSHSTIIPGKKIGRCSKISAGSVVYHDIEPFSLAIGNPAKSRIMFLPT